MGMALPGIVVGEQVFETPKDEIVVDGQPIGVTTARHALNNYQQPVYPEYLGNQQAQQLDMETGQIVQPEEIIVQPSLGLLNSPRVHPSDVVSLDNDSLDSMDSETREYFARYGSQTDQRLVHYAMPVHPADPSNIDPMFNQEMTVDLRYPPAYAETETVPAAHGQNENQLHDVQLYSASHHPRPPVRGSVDLLGTSPDDITELHSTIGGGYHEKERSPERNGVTDALYTLFTGGCITERNTNERDVRTAPSGGVIGSVVNRFC